jgi:hypothetical protein
VEHETPSPEFAERQRGRAVRRTVEAAAHEVSPAEQAALGEAVKTPGAALRSSMVVGLQRTAGNGAVTALVQRSLAGPAEQEELSPVLGVVGKGRGQPLDPTLRNEMEARLGDDFAEVRIHTDAEAARSAGAVSARAYTVGNEIVFGTDAPALDTDQGKRTLAHELTHVMQQRSGPVAGTATRDGISISDPSDRFEQAAEANSLRVMSDRVSEARSPGRDGAGNLTVAAPTQRESIEAAEEEEESAEYTEQAANYQEEAAEYTEQAAEYAEEEAPESQEEAAEYTEQAAEYEEEAAESQQEAAEAQEEVSEAEEEEVEVG